MSAHEDPDIAFLAQYVESAMRERESFGGGGVRAGDLASQAMLRALTSLYERVERLESEQRFSSASASSERRR